MLDPAEARQLIDAIDTTTVIGLRDRALIGLMVYSFARIGTAIGMRVEDVYTQSGRLWCACTRRAASSTLCRATTVIARCDRERCKWDGKRSKARPKGRCGPMAENVGRCASTLRAQIQARRPVSQQIARAGAVSLTSREGRRGIVTLTSWEWASG